MLTKALNIINNYIELRFTSKEVNLIQAEMNKMFPNYYDFTDENFNIDSFEELQIILSKLNEKESFRKAKGVYYTPVDVVRFIVEKSFTFYYTKFDSSIDKINTDNRLIRDLCYSRTVFDPTCGSGEFLIESLIYKINLIPQNNLNKKNIHQVVKSIHGNDINYESVGLTKLRILLIILEKFGVNNIVGLSKILNNNFKNFDYIQNKDISNESFDIILGNPPYVEQSKYSFNLEKKYGNIYAHVLDNALQQLKFGGVIGFIIPLSYVSTPRMKKIRNVVNQIVQQQVILNYSDRPDCLFTSVHQKLSIFFGKNSGGTAKIYTGNYKYWYKEERNQLFESIDIVNNDYIVDDYIPKLGNITDKSVFEKILLNNNSINSIFEDGIYGISINMRATFWIKAFLGKHEGSEYKRFCTSNQNSANYAMCLFNSSLFWWYWICISDCWHITKKELYNFKIPLNYDVNIVNRLANQLENMLERTKVYVATKQTDYEYKHKLCINEIHEIDDYINSLYGLTEEEGEYIKNFAYKYRTGGGMK